MLKQCPDCGFNTKHHVSALKQIKKTQPAPQGVESWTVHSGSTSLFPDQVTSTGLPVLISSSYSYFLQTAPPLGQRQTRTQKLAMYKLSHRIGVHNLFSTY